MVQEQQNNTISSLLEAKQVYVIVFHFVEIAQMKKYDIRNIYKNLINKDCFNKKANIKYI